MNHPTLADREHCTGCLVCADVCAQNAITCVINDEGHYTYKVDENKCILCHCCEKVCPMVNGSQYGSNELKISQPFAAWTTDDTLRARATSGGVFPAVAKNIIGQGGVAFGAVQEQYYVHHKAIERTEKIAKLQGSKYSQSKTEGIYRQVRAMLDSGREVLFSGVGCQVAALLSYLKGNKHLENLTTIDLICGGVPSLFLIKKFVEQYGAQFERIAAYRTKNKYEFSVFDKNGQKKVIPTAERPFPLCGFTSGATERYSCYDCPFAKGHRNSDITIGDYWGNTLFISQKQKGVSVAVVHTEKGLAAMKESEIDMHEIDWRDFLMNNPRMACGMGEITDSRRRMAKAFQTYSYEHLLEVYANKGTFTKPWTMVNRVIRILKGRDVTQKRKHIIEEILKDNEL